MLKTKYRWITIAGALALALLVGGVSLLASTSVASAAETTADDLKTITQASTGPGLLGDGYLAHGGGWGFKGSTIDYQQLLADALGISVDDLQAAYETARTAAIEQAVKEGLITREQADEMLVWGGWNRKGAAFFGFRRGRKGVASDTIDENALLADALGITVQELDAARETANQAAIAQAVAEGIITQEQADEMLARKNLQSYLDRDVLLAKALGMTAEELQAAYAEGKTLTVLMSEKGLDAAAVREALQKVYAEAVAQAVADGIITQDQADEMQDGRGMMSGERMMPGGRGRFPGRGGADGNRPSRPDTDDDDTSGMHFHRAGRGVQGENAL
ncbi:MAG: hypothetical protein JW934_12870 [Anaerolineae bacterium]|nr:hypothetical protein [Anaerolineae bacterium]